MVGQPEIPAAAVAIEGTENEASKDVEEPPTEDSKKYGFLLPNATPEDVWKPESDSDGNLVTLSSLAGPHIIQEALPTGQLEAVVIKYQHPDGEVTSWEVVRPQHTPGDVVETGEYKGMFLDGVRHMYRWSKPGKEYPKQCFWINGGGTESLILDSAVRHQCFPPAPFNEKIPFNLNQTKPNDDEGTPTPTIPSGTNPGNPGNSDGGGGL